MLWQIVWHFNDPRLFCMAPGSRWKSRSPCDCMEVTRLEVALEIEEFDARLNESFRHPKPCKPKTLRTLKPYTLNQM